jgi:hypothetical protein
MRGIEDANIRGFENLKMRGFDSSAALHAYGWDTFLNFAFSAKNEVLNPIRGEMCDPFRVDVLGFTVFLYTFDPIGVAYL